MIGRNNLGKGYHNTYWKVSRGFKVLSHIGYVDDPNKNPLDWPIPVFEEIKTKAGDEIHDLHGGVCWFKKGKTVAHRIMMTTEVKEQLFPEKSLKQLSFEDAIKATAYTNGQAYNLLSKDDIVRKGLFIGTP